MHIEGKQRFPKQSELEFTAMKAVLSVVVVILSSCCTTGTAENTPLPSCDGYLESVLIDFESDDKGKAFAVGDKPTRLPGRIRVFGKRSPRHTAGENDLAIFDATRFDEEYHELRDFPERNVLVVNSSDGVRSNENLIVNQKGGNVIFLLPKRVLRVDKLRLMDIDENHGTVVAITRNSTKLSVPIPRGDRLFSGPFQGPDVKKTFMKFENFVNIRRLQVNLRGTSAIAALRVTVCKKIEHCSPESGTPCKEVWRPAGPQLLGLGKQDRPKIQLSGDGRTMISADPEAGNTGQNGQIRVFRWNGAEWLPKGQLLAFEEERNVLFGSTIDISRDGNTFIASANGFRDPSFAQAFRYNMQADLWESHGQRLEESVVSMSDDASFMVGGRKSGGGYRAFAFNNSTNIWHQIGEGILATDDKYRRFGNRPAHVSADGTTFAIGFPEGCRDNSCNVGRVDVFRRDTLTNKIAKLGQTIRGQSGEAVGETVSLSGNGRVMALIGKFFVKIYKFEEDVGRWKRFPHRIPVQFGDIQLSDDGRILVIGDGAGPRPSRDSHTLQGQIRTYRLDDDGARWVRFGQPLIGRFRDDEGGRDDFGSQLGRTVTMSGDGTMIAASTIDIENFNKAGETGEVQVWSLTHVPR